MFVEILELRDFSGNFIEHMAVGKGHQNRNGRDKSGLKPVAQDADLRQSLLDMGLDSAILQRLGIRILRLGMTYPFDQDIARRFAAGLENIIVIEEKRSFVETQLSEALYGMSQHPRLVGKQDEDGMPLFPIHGELDADMITERLGPRLQHLGEAPGIAARLAIIDAIRGRAYDDVMTRKPNYCSAFWKNSVTRETLRVVGGSVPSPVEIKNGVTSC